MNVLMKVVKDFDLEIISQDFQLECVMVLSIKDKVIAVICGVAIGFYTLMNNKIVKIFLVAIPGGKI